MTPDERAAFRDATEAGWRLRRADILRILDALDAETDRADAAEADATAYLRLANIAAEARDEARAEVERLRAES